MYLLFAGFSYYPCGGFDDFIDSYSCIDSCKRAFAILKKEHSYDWAHVVDIDKKEIVTQCSGGAEWKDT